LNGIRLSTFSDRARAKTFFDASIPENGGEHPQNSARAIDIASVEPIDFV
jgi:hypothetical protein